MSRTYQDAIRLLTSRSKAFKKVPIGPGGEPRPPRGNDVGMRAWLSALGHDTKESKRPFDVIHVTGTKGKGGTCAWTDALLRSHLRRHHTNNNCKVGLYTSPHIASERERIRIDFAPVSEAAFARHFFDVWSTILKNVGGDVDEMPGYLQMLALLSAHIFRKEGVAVAVYEVHAGGRFDSTNLWDAPVACGFSTIGLDHVGLLGSNVGEIAWNKAGIMKMGARAFSVAQGPEAAEQLVREAEQLGCLLVFVGSDDAAVPKQAGQHRPELLLPQPRGNLALAIRLANAYLEARLGARLSEDDIMEAVRTYQWPGRFQVVEVPGARTRWYLDFAHNDMSLPVALDWFAAEVDKFDEAEAREPGQEPDGEWERDPPRRRSKVLIFGHQSHHRETAPIVRAVVRHCEEKKLVFDRVILAGYSRRVSGRQVFDHESAQAVMEIWRQMPDSPEVTWYPTIKNALESAEGWASSPQLRGSHALIVGSSHLVSSAVAAMPGSLLG